MQETKRAPQINLGRIRLAEYDRQDWVANAEEGTTIDDIKEPAYWALIASQFKPYDHIEVRAEDGTWIADLVVMGCDRTWARVHVKNVHKLTSGDVSMSQASKHEVFWRGPQHKWAIKRTADHEVVKNECATREEAEKWLKEYEKTIA
jgi:hypothetical protein